MRARTKRIVLLCAMVVLLIQQGALFYSVMPSEIEPTDNDETVTRTMFFNGNQIDLEIRVGDVEGCPTGLFRTLNPGIVTAKFIGTAENTVIRLSEMIRPYTEGMSEYDLAESLLDMVQNDIGYESDSDQFGEDEWGQFPCETLYNQSGDCEDMAFLLSSLYRIFGIDHVIISCSGHMSIGVNVEGATGNYVLKTISVDSPRYYIADPSSNKPIGQETEESVLWVSEKVSAIIVALQIATLIEFIVIIYLFFRRD